eukprot:1059513-Prymnesium_polylepis.1
MPDNEAPRSASLVANAPECPRPASAARERRPAASAAPPAALRAASRARGLSWRRQRARTASPPARSARTPRAPGPRRAP